MLRLLDEARTWLFPLYSSSLTPAWLRSLGAKIGRDVEASTVLLIPSLTSVSDGAFLADDTLLGGYELGGGWLRIDRVKIGKHAFLGNSGMAAPGRKVPKQGLVAVLSAAPRRKQAKSGTSWLGSPPAELRRQAGSADDEPDLPAAPRLRVARAFVELLPRRARWSSRPCSASVSSSALVTLADRAGWWVAALLSGVVLIVAGAVAAGVATVAKWLLVGRLKRVRPPAVELVRVAQRAGRHVRRGDRRPVVRAGRDGDAGAQPVAALDGRAGRARACGARPTGCPRPTWSHLRDGVTVNQGCVVQTHLFHDRMLSMDTVTLRAGADARAQQRDPARGRARAGTLPSARCRW